MHTSVMILLVTCLALLSKISCAEPVDAPQQGCSFAIPDLQPEAVIVNANHEFIYPAPDDNQIRLQPNEKIIVTCPGATVNVGSQAFASVEAICSSGSKFLVNDEEIDFAQLSCSSFAHNTARYTGGLCELNGREAEIGYQLPDKTFIRQIRICFDPISQNTLYSEYNLTRSIGHHEHNVRRPFFVQDSFYHVGGSVNYLYIRKHQRATINNLVGLPVGSTKYIQNFDDFYLARGHFTAKADFVYGFQQNATFHYINVAPQWQTFNGGNWEVTESDVRAYAEKNTLDLVVYTGGYGVAKLPHEKTGQDVELYLYVDGNKRGIAVPELYWKVVYNPATKQGVALIGVNNPYRKDVENSIICEDVSAQLDWLTWDAHNIQAGFSYACDVNDFRKTVHYLPDIQVTSLLK